jgi:hypothetical protein
MKASKNTKCARKKEKKKEKKERKQATSITTHIVYKPTPRKNTLYTSNITKVAKVIKYYIMHLFAKFEAHHNSAG